jgi:hypothetical protein
MILLSNDCSGYWAILYPSEFMFILILGIGWEIVESLFHDRPFYLKECHYTLSDKQKSGWWYGRWEDIVMNILGMITGYYLGMLRTSG